MPADPAARALYLIDLTVRGVVPRVPASCGGPDAVWARLLVSLCTAKDPTQRPTFETLAGVLSGCIEADVPTADNIDSDSFLGAPPPGTSRHQVPFGSAGQGGGDRRHDRDVVTTVTQFDETLGESLSSRPRRYHVSTAPH